VHWQCRLDKNVSILLQKTGQKAPAFKREMNGRVACRFRAYQAE
jgi:hypothetical protein